MYIKWQCALTVVHHCSNYSLCAESNDLVNIIKGL